MSDYFWLTSAQIKRIEPYFPLSHGMPRVDDQRVISGIIHVIKLGLQWRDAPSEYGPPKTLYNRFVRWSRMGIFDRIFSELAAGSLNISWVVTDLFDRANASQRQEETKMICKLGIITSNGFA